MANSKKRNAQDAGSESNQLGSDSTGPQAAIESRFWSKPIKRIVSIVLVLYLFVLLIGPMSNPVGSEFLTRPLAELVAPIHRLLFLGHGYRFFGPDPGPGHLLVYRITDNSGQLKESHFPDREKNWPRLMYHRWFMLSETIFQEHASTLDKSSFETTDAELAAQIKALRLNGKFKLSEKLVTERNRRTQQYESSRKRIDKLVSAVAKHLLNENQGQQIEMFVQERNIPFPVQVLTGSKLDEEQFLSPLIKIGEFKVDSQGDVISLEVPTQNQQEPLNPSDSESTEPEAK